MLKKRGIQIRKNSKTEYMMAGYLRSCRQSSSMAHPGTSGAGRSQVERI